MPRNSFATILLAILFSPFFLYGAQRQLPQETDEEVQFKVTGESGSYQGTAKLISRTAGVGRYAIRFPSPVISEYPENNIVSGELYLPLEGDWAGDPTILLHILNGDFSLVRLISLELAEAGVPAFWFKLPFYGERRPEKITSEKPVTSEQLLQLIDQGGEDFRRSVDFMQQLVNAPATTVNVTGISMGGILAYHFASLEPRTGRICSIMGGGDLWGIVQTARETSSLWKEFSSLSQKDQAALKKEIFKRDPLNAAIHLKDKAAVGDILMINATEDEVIPRKHAEQLAEALGMSEQIVWMAGVGHYTMAARLKDVIQMQIDFFTNNKTLGTHKTNSLPPTDESDVALLSRFLTQLGDILDPTTVVTTGQQLNLEYTFRDGSQTDRSGSLHWQRSSTGYSLQLMEQEFGEFGLGDSNRPWLFIGKQRTLLQGQEHGQRMTHLEQTGNSLSMKLQLLSNFLKFGARIPGFLDKHGTLESVRDGANRCLSYRLKSQPASLSLAYNTSAQQFTTVEINHKDKQLTLKIKAMDVQIAADRLQLKPPTTTRNLSVTSLYLQHTVALLLEVIDAQLSIQLP